MPAVWGNIAENRFCDLLVYSNLSNCNYRIFVKEILLEIGFIEIGFISSNWPATRPHYSSNFCSEKIGPRRTIQLAYTYTSSSVARGATAFPIGRSTKMQNKKIPRF